MNVFGIELRKDFWSAVHLEKGLYGFKVKGYYAFKGDTDEARLEALKKLFFEISLKGVVIALSLPMGWAFSRAIRLPAPDTQSLEGILRFELEKHIPISIEDVYYDFNILGSTDNTHTVIFSAIKKKILDRTIEKFRVCGIEPVFVCPPNISLYNTLRYLKRLPEDKNISFISLFDDRAAIDTFSGYLPADSRSIRKVEDGLLVEKFEREIRFSATSIEASSKENKLSEIRILSSEGEGVLNSLKGFFNIPVTAERLEINGNGAISPYAFGAALGPFRKGAININLCPASVLTREKPLPMTGALVCIALLSMVFAGSSFLIKDVLTLAKLDRLISTVEADSKKIKNLAADLESNEDRIRILEGLKGRTGDNLKVLKGLSDTIPKGTWLTGFEYEKNGVVIEGFSDQATTFLLSLGQSGVIDNPEFAGPVTKTRQGKERFRIRAGIKGLEYTGEQKI